MAIYKNIASQTLAVFAWDTVNGQPKTGDAANITAQISKDGGASAATDDVNPTELDANDQPGVYVFNLTQAETNADLIVVSAASSSAAIEFEPVIAYTVIQQTGDSYARIGANGAGLTALPWNSAWDAEVQSECADALAAYNVVATTDLPSNFGSLGINGSGHVSRVTLTDTTTTNTDMRGTDSAYTGTPPTAAAIRSEIDSNSTQLAAILADTNDLQANQGDWLTATGFSTLTTGDIDARLAAYDPPTKAELDAAVAGLNDLSAAQVNAEVDTAIETYHLDHLLAAAYDPTSKPGNASGLLNVIFENDGGVPRYTANALEQGPSGGGGSADWTDGEKEQIRYRLQLDGDQTEPTDTDLPEVNVKQVNGTAVSLSNITFTVNNSVDSDGTIKVRRGTDYSPTIGTQLDVIKSGYASGAFSSGASGTFRYRQADGSLVTAGSVSISQSGDTVTATITLTDTEIDAMVANKAGTWECDITSSGGLIADHGKGKLIVTDKVA